MPYRISEIKYDKLSKDIAYIKEFTLEKEGNVKNVYLNLNIESSPNAKIGDTKQLYVIYSGTYYGVEKKFKDIINVHIIEPRKIYMKIDEKQTFKALEDDKSKTLSSNGTIFRYIEGNTKIITGENNKSTQSVTFFKRGEGFSKIEKQYHYYKENKLDTNVYADSITQYVDVFEIYDENQRPNSNSIDGLSIEKTVDKETATGGDTLEYTIKIKNSDSVPKNLEIQDFLPSGIDFENIETSILPTEIKNDCEYYWSFEEFPVGEQEIKIKVKLLDNVSGMIRNIAELISGDGSKKESIAEVVATPKTYKVTWYDEDRTTILDTNTFLADSTEPEFRYELPKKEKDENYIYEFKEWIKLDIPLNDDTISYVAEYEKIEIKTIPVTISTTFQNEISLSHPTLDDISKDFHMEYNYIDEDGEHNGILSYEEAQKSLTSSGYPILTWNPISIKTKNIKGDKLNINLKQNNYLVNNAEYVRTYSSDGGNRQNGTGIISVSCASNALQNTINNYYQESEKKYGFYIVNHEYYTKDKNGNLALDRTISDKPVTLESGTILNTYTIKQKPEADYNFSEISENTITIEADIQKTVTIKYIREEKYGSYIVKHEYYVKDKDGNLILENTVSNDISNTVVDTIIDANEIEQILEHNNHIYEFSEHTGNITIEESSTKEIIFKYIREEKYGSYQVKHEYYIRDKEGNVSLENVKEEDTISDVVVGTLIKSSEQKQYLEFNKKTYSLLEEANDTIIEENKVSEIIFKYVREKEYGSYVVKHNYYLKDKNGNFILEETVSENPILTEPGNIIGLKDTDIIIPQKLKDRYTLKDASENMIIEANGETEFIVNYFREEPIILKYGSYQVVHQYYLDDTLEATINEELVSNVLAGTSIGIIDTDIIISKKENHDNKEYIFDSVDKAIIKEDETVIVTIKYIRKNQSVVEPVSVTITANKELKNASLKENQFSFRLSNNVDTYIASNDVNGNISFKPITFNREGTYKYYLTEDNTKEANIKYDSSIYDVEITVSKSKNSLIAIVKYLRDGKEVEKAVFTNSYKEPEQVTQPPSEENTNNNETITVIPEEEPPKIIVKQPQNQNKNDDFIEIEDEPVPKAIQPSQTGDDSQIFMYIILLILSGFCLFIKNKKK